MEIIKTLTLVFFLVFGMTTSVFASWWNPFTWHWFKRNIVVEQQVLTNNTLPVIQNSQAKKEVTIITNDGGITFSGGTVLIIKDIDGKKWTVEYKDTKYYESWIDNGKELSRSGDFDFWLKSHKQVSSVGYDGPGIPGTTKITGFVDESGILQASKISQHVQ